MASVFHREVSGEKCRVGGGEASVERQGHSSFQSSDIVCFHCCYWTHPCSSTRLSSNKAVKKQARNQCGPASACCVQANRALTSRCKSLGDAPLCLLPVTSRKGWTPSPELVHGYGMFLRHLQFYYRFTGSSPDSKASTFSGCTTMC